jgi:hypothetical protein
VYQIKIFKNVEADLQSLEREVNAWLAESRVEVQHIFGNIAPQTTPKDAQAPGLTKGSFAPSDVLLVVLYRQ